MIEDMLRNCGIDKRDLTHIAAANGPGSFTGTRIGCATAKGLSWALGIPCRPVSSLEAMARSAHRQSVTGEVISPVMDARRGQVYNALFESSKDGFVRLTPDRALPFDDLTLELEHLGSAFRIVRESDAWGVVLAATDAPDAEANPVYLRAPQAERERNAALGKNESVVPHYAASL
jgi:tRNA threonylcarbamoyladenosine biosynthesis protein TsaB